MTVTKQVRIVHWSMAGAAALLALAVALSAAALIHLSLLHTTMVSEAQLNQVSTDLANNIAIEAVAVLVLGTITLFMRRQSTKVRIAIWVAAPILAITTLCFLVGGPEWAVAPTGDEPANLRAEYAQVVPDWYTWPHGTAGVLAAGLLLFVAVFMTRSDLREYYMDNGVDPNRPYTSWVERTGG